MFMGIPFEGSIAQNLKDPITQNVHLRSILANQYKSNVDF
jgi:hypothetical protein